MLDERSLKNIAYDELIKIYGKQYLRVNYDNTWICHGMLSDGRFMLFVGIKTEDDLPDLPADEKGWVVSANIWLDQKTGEVLDIRYTKE